MHGRSRIPLICGLLLALGLAGCEEDAPAVVPPPEPPAGPGPRFDAARTGTVEGRVLWHGPRPVVPPFRSVPEPLIITAGGPPREWPNPHEPRVGPEGGLAWAVVYLRGVPAERSRAWGHPPARVELRGQRVEVCQGEARGPVGVVQRGGSVEVVSRDDVAHSLQGRGANFFARALPWPGLGCQVALPQAGVVELVSGAGYFWMRGHLFVSEHPYVTTTGPDGRFRLTQVPEGDCEVVCWLPDWRVADWGYDGDCGRPWRATFRPPREVVRPLRVVAGQARAVSFSLSAQGP